MFVCSNLSGIYLKDWCKMPVFVSPNSEFTVVGTPEKPNKKPAVTWGRRWSWSIRDSAKSVQEKLERVWEIREFKSTCIYWGIKRVIHMLGVACKLRKDRRGIPPASTPPTFLFFLSQIISLLAFKEICQNSSWTQTKGTENLETTYD